ncbi:hypothetical protein [Burkholderia sp. Ac-20365]|uniref:hypothetical protein n=1 Tax=Burkholderia sp. Ac-20365 TaxID=2703897 RepID=UPI00197B89F3|nr:hypothetical protein [Burkholderia sp. Ac-20365]MBN3761171.1 hypothetical protein [Burkholderia sp. Ac-20365]
MSDKKRYVVRNAESASVLETDARFSAWWAWFSQRKLGFTLEAAEPPFTKGQQLLLQIGIFLAVVAGAIAGLIFLAWAIPDVISDFRADMQTPSLHAAFQRNDDFFSGMGGTVLIAAVPVVILFMTIRSALRSQNG